MQVSNDMIAVRDSRQTDEPAIAVLIDRCEAAGLRLMVGVIGEAEMMHQLTCTGH